MTIEKRTKKFVIAGIAAALVLGGGGAAFAYWTAQGIGSGTATTGESVAFLVTSDPPVGDPLTPGGPAQTVTINVTNEAEGDQTLLAVTAQIANPDGTAWIVTGCSAADYTVGTPVFVYGGIASGATLSGTVTIELINSGVNQDGCQNVDVPLYFVAN